MKPPQLNHNKTTMTELPRNHYEPPRNHHEPPRLNHHEPPRNHHDWNTPNKPPWTTMTEPSCHPTPTLCHPHHLPSPEGRIEEWGGNHPTSLKLFGNKGDRGWGWQGVGVTGGEVPGNRIEKEWGGNHPPLLNCLAIKGMGWQWVGGGLEWHSWGWQGVGVARGRGGRGGSGRRWGWQGARVTGGRIAKEWGSNHSTAYPCHPQTLPPPPLPPYPTPPTSVLCFLCI